MAPLPLNSLVIPNDHDFLGLFILLQVISTYLTLTCTLDLQALQATLYFFIPFPLQYTENMLKAEITRKDWWEVGASKWSWG